MTQGPTAAGRPRDDALDERIVTAALSVLRVRGFEGFTVEAIAEQARCGKTSIYRRYRNRDEILTAVLDGLAGSAGERDRSAEADLRGQLVAAMDGFRAGIEDEIGLRGVASLLYDPGSPFAALLRRHLLVPRLRTLVDLLQRGMDVGELRVGTDAEAQVYAMAGSYFARLAVAGHVEDDWAARTVDQLWPEGRGNRGSSARIGPEDPP